MLTMTIVGVVAALTIPTLHYQRVKKEYSAKLKNYYSKMNNAILDMEMDKGSFRDMTLPSSNRPQADFNWYMENIDPYVGHAFTKDRSIYFKDGSKMTLPCGAGCTCMDVYYDLNGDKSPNRPGYDIHVFLFCFDKAQREGHFGSDDIFFGTYGGGLTNAGISRESMIDKCKNTSGSYCTRLLQNDQWEFKKDYPYKF